MDGCVLIKIWDQIEKDPNLDFEEVYSLSKNIFNPELQRRLVAFEYRQKLKNPAKPEKCDLECLLRLALEWKKKPIMTAKDSDQLRKTAEYPLFVELIKNNRQLREKFLTWSLCDGNDVVPFIEFPATIDQLILCRLSSRMGRHPHACLRIENKKLLLPFEGKYHSIMNLESIINFRGNYSLKIGEIFEIFKNKEIDIGNLEYFKEGICNWNIHHLAYFDANLNQLISIDLNRKNWWEQMPPFEILTRRQMIKRYGRSLNHHEWIVAAVATRGRDNLDYEETHSFLEVAIPQKNGLFAIYDFGKLATEYPQDALDRIAMMTKNVHAAIAYPDDNVFYSQRERGFYPFAIKNREGIALMELLKADIITSRNKNMVYQIQSENCAKWVYSTLVKVLGEKKVPDFFRMQLLDTEPQGPVALLFRGIKLLPLFFQVPLLMFLHMPLGAFRKVWIEEEGEKVAKSLNAHNFFKTGQIFLPALLIAKVTNVLCVRFKIILRRTFQHFLPNIFWYDKFRDYGIYKYKFCLDESLREAKEITSDSTTARFKTCSSRKKSADLQPSF